MDVSIAADGVGVAFVGYARYYGKSRSAANPFGGVSEIVERLCSMAHGTCGDRVCMEHGTWNMERGG